VLGYGRDGNSCLVRPILRDGTPVFPDPEMTSRRVTSDHPPRSELTADLSTKTGSHRGSAPTQPRSSKNAPAGSAAAPPPPPSQPDVPS
jgi:hypothetical protein